MAAAVSRFSLNKSVLHLAQGEAVPQMLPPALAETLPHLPKMEGSFAMLCNGKGCLPPVKTVDELIEAMNQSL